MFSRTRLALICCAALLVAAPTAEARPAAPATATAAPSLGVYNCFSKGYPIVYQGSVQLLAGGRYGWGYLNTATRKLKSPRWGSYRVAGSRITWSGGSLAKLYGVVKTARKFEIWSSGQKFSSYTCYFKF